jgi:hypothetical protein
MSMTEDEPRPTTPLDEIYAALLREQPTNDVLWERIMERAKASGRDRDPGEDDA